MTLTVPEPLRVALVPVMMSAAAGVKVADEPMDIVPPEAIVKFPLPVTVALDARVRLPNVTAVPLLVIEEVPLMVTVPVE